MQTRRSAACLAGKCKCSSNYRKDTLRGGVTKKKLNFFGPKIFGLKIVFDKNSFLIKYYGHEIWFDL